MSKIALAFFSAILPFSAVFADDGVTRSLDNNAYQQSGHVLCIGNDCSIYFPATTATNTEITNVSCTFLLRNGDQVQGASLGSQHGSSPFYLQPFVVGVGQDNTTFGINSITRLFVSQGDVPLVFLDFFNIEGTEANCTISGVHS